MNRTRRRLLLAAPLAAAVVAGGGITAVDAQTPPPGAGRYANLTPEQHRLGPNEASRTLPDGTTLRRMPGGVVGRYGPDGQAVPLTAGVRPADLATAGAPGSPPPAPAGPAVTRFDATKGKRVTIAGKDVQLPPDAGVEGVIRGTPAAARQPDGTYTVVDKQGRPVAAPFDTQVTVVARGGKRAYVGHTSKKVLRQDEGGDFGFLKAVFP